MDLLIEQTLDGQGRVVLYRACRIPNAALTFVTPWGDTRHRVEYDEAGALSMSITGGTLTSHVLTGEERSRARGAIAAAVLAPLPPVLHEDAREFVLALLRGKEIVRQPIDGPAPIAMAFAFVEVLTNRVAWMLERPVQRAEGPSANTLAWSCERRDPALANVWVLGYYNPI